MSPKPGIRKPRKTPNPAGAGDEGWRVGKGLLGEIAAIATGLKYFTVQNGGDTRCCVAGQTALPRLFGVGL